MRFILFAALLMPMSLFADAAAAFPPHPLDERGGFSAPAAANGNAQAIYWINLIDQHQFPATWLEASGLLRDVVTEEQWADAMGRMRADLGTVNSRKVLSHESSHELPNGTRGTFITFVFRTGYARLPSATETITLMREGPLGSWKVVNYDITGE